MKLPFSTTIARWRGARLLRALVTEQRRTADALETLVGRIDQLGRMLAAAHHQSWISLQTLQSAPTDESSIGSPDDTFFGHAEAIADDYRERFGREISEEEILAVYAEHRAARQGDGDPTEH